MWNGNTLNKLLFTAFVKHLTWINTSVDPSKYSGHVITHKKVLKKTGFKELTNESIGSNQKPINHWAVILWVWYTMPDWLIDQSHDCFRPIAQVIS